MNITITESQYKLINKALLVLSEMDRRAADVVTEDPATPRSESRAKHYEEEIREIAEICQSLKEQT